MFIYKWWFVFFATRVGRSYLQLEKLQLEKIKSKRKYVQIEKIKTKRIEKKAMYRLKNKKIKIKKCLFTNESLPVPCVIDQCSRGDRTCG